MLSKTFKNTSIDSRKSKNIQAYLKKIIFKYENVPEHLGICMNEGGCGDAYERQTDPAHAILSLFDK